MHFRRKRGFIPAASIAALVFCLFIVPALAEDTVIRLTFTGDCTIGGEDRLEAKDYSFHGYVRKYGYAWPFANFREYFSEDDLTIVNLENVLYDSTRGRAQKPINFRGPTDYVSVLLEGSVEAAFVANNHQMDYGEAGFASTVSALEGAGIAWFGDSEMGSKPFIFEKEGVKIGFVGCYTSYWVRSFKNLRGTFDALREAGCNAVVAVMHGGSEYAPRRARVQERMAAWVIREGADLVIGHHPHVVQGVDVLDGVSIVYSLGNFVFGGNKDVIAARALIARAEMHFNQDGEYLGHQLTLVPVAPSGERNFNNYQPVFLTGGDAEKTMALAQRDSAFALAPLVDGVGSAQPFLPAHAPAQP